MSVRTDLSPADRLAAGLTGPVERRETHAAWVLLAGDRALKVRKPVRFSFLDYSTLERRLAAAEEEVRVNEVLAPGVYRGVRALLEHDGRLEAGPFGRHADAVEYAVEMRRFDEARTMAALAAAGRLEEQQVDAVAALLARFHAEAEPCEGGAHVFHARVREDVADVAQLLPERMEPRAAALRRYAEAALVRRADQLDARARRGLWRDGHGDLRAEHVVFERRALVVDRIEFDPALRRTDVGSDLAFLAMDLEAHGHAWAAERLVAAYARAGGDPGDARLRALFAWQRALVRAKVALLRGDERAALRLLQLADRLAWRERMPAVLLVLGAPGSGKSTLAAELGRLSGLPVLGSDAVRKAMHGVRATARLAPGAYADDVTRSVYRALGHRAARARADRGGAIVDATGRSRALRRALLAGLGDAGPVVAVVCDAPAAVRRARVRARLADPARVSDADVAVAERLAAGFEPLAAEPGIDRVLVLSTAPPPAAVLGELAARLDDAAWAGAA